MLDEFVYGLRKARSEKLSSTLFVLLLTVGLSTTAVVGGLLNSIVLKSLPVRNPNSLLLDVIGKKFSLNKVPFVVVEVLQRDFHSLDVERAPDVWLPTSAVLALDSRPVDDVKEGGNFAYQVLVRLAPGVGKDPAARALEPPLRADDEWSWRQRAASFVPPMAAVQVATIAQSVRNYHLAVMPAGQGLSQLRDKFSQALYLLAGASAVLWLMVCTSMGGLLLVKGAARSRELSIRLALGATRSRIVRELFLENLSLVILSVTLSLLLAYHLSAMILRLLPEVRIVYQELRSQNHFHCA